MLRFAIDDAVRDLGVRGAFAVLTGLNNRDDPPALNAWRTALVERLRQELHPHFIAEDATLAGFRALHDRIGRSNRRFPASAEALVELFQRKHVVPIINPLVDIYNGISLSTRLSLGAHDVRYVKGNITLRFTTGNEQFLPLGALLADTVPAGEYCYIDDANEILCRLEHRQCEHTKVTRDTTECFYILQGHEGTPRETIAQVLDQLTRTTIDMCGGRMLESWIVA